MAAAPDPDQAKRLGGNRLTMAGDISVSNTRAFAARGRTDSQRMFRAAIRHSRFVRTMRVAVPGGVLLGIAAMVIVSTWFDPLAALAKLPVDIGGVVVSGTKITMKQPRVSGFTRDSRSYTVTARSAVQDLTNPDTLELQDINASMDLQNRGRFDLTARDGVYETKNERLTLHNDIVVVSTGYAGRLSEAVINIRTGHIVSERPVEVRSQQITINANRLEVTNNGEVILFDRGVTMTVEGANLQPSTAGAR
jgi:lipopolysaccharide export system protein LptC